MFAVPKAKSVRRSELDSLPSSRHASPDAETSQAAQAKLAAYFSDAYAAPEALTEPGSTNTTTLTEDNDKHTQAEDEEGVYSFRLFAKPSDQTNESDKIAATKIAIRSPSPVNAEPGLIKSRSKEYYMYKPWSIEQRAKVASIVHTPEQIIDEATRRWTGCELPWRVQRIRITKTQAQALDSEPTATLTGEIDGEKLERKRRPNKKRRIILRTRARAKLEKAQKLKQNAEDKEAAEREKRTRRNREKKVKKKQREKAKKEVGTDAVLGDTEPAGGV